MKDGTQLENEPKKHHENSNKILFFETELSVYVNAYDLRLVFVFRKVRKLRKTI